MCELFHNTANTITLNSYDDYISFPTFEQKCLTALVAGANGIRLQHQVVLDTNKARSMGFFGHVDSTRECFDVFRRAERLKLLLSP